MQCSASGASDVSALQEQFGIADHVEVTTGREGLPIVRLTHSCGASAEVNALSSFVSMSQPVYLLQHVRSLYVPLLWLSWLLD